jgi:formate C-acetyltransferase/benzylsuccinate synthase
MCNDVPKFGTANIYVDTILNDLFEMVGGEAAKFKDFTGAKYDVQYHSVSTFLTMGMVDPALPNGRRKGEPLYDGGISPKAGVASDPISVLKSVSTVDASKTQRILHNMRLSPNTTNKQFVNLIRTWNDLGLSQIQFNVVKTETLRDAQKQPEKYEDLLVRVAGYSAVYVNLAAPVQETIIARTELEAPK